MDSEKFSPGEFEKIKPKLKIKKKLNKDLDWALRFLLILVLNFKKGNKMEEK